MMVITFELCTYLALFDLNKEVIHLLTILVLRQSGKLGSMRTVQVWNMWSLSFGYLENHKTYGQCVFSI